MQRWHSLWAGHVLLISTSPPGRDDALNSDANNFNTRSAFDPLACIPHEAHFAFSN